MFGLRNRRKNKNTSVKTLSRRWRPMLETLEDRTVPTVTILNGGGLGYAGLGGANPPDTCGAAGPVSYIEVINGSIRIFANKTTGTPTVTGSLDTFLYTTGGLPLQPTRDGSDSSMIYDNLMGRFIIGDLDADDVGNTSNYNIGVSKTNNPTTLTTADWNFYQIHTTEGANWTDYEGNLGFNADAVVITFNMAHNTSLTGDTQIVSINANDLANGVAAPAIFHNDIVGQNRFRPTTMHDAAPGDPMWLIRNPNTGVDLNVNRMNNVLSNAATYNNNLLPLPAAANFSTGDISPLNPNGSAMSDIDTRILKAGEYNNTIVATHKIKVSATEADAQWYAIDVSGAVPTFQLVGGVQNVGRVGFGANTYCFDPGIDINSTGQIGLCFNESDTVGGAANAATGGFVSTFVAARSPNDAAGTMQTSVLVPAGTGSATITGRTGDFSGMNVDPVNGTFWGVNEFGAATRGTAIANFTPSFQLTGTADNITIRVNPLDPTQIQVLATGTNTVLTTFPNNSPVLQFITGNANNNEVTVDESFGNVNTPITFDGVSSPGAPGDRMIFIGSSGNDTLNVNATTATTAGTSFNGAALISFLNIQQLSFNGQGGNDALVVDSTTSLLALANGIQYDGGTGLNSLRLSQTGGAVQTSDRYNVGPNPGQGSSVIVGAAGTQSVSFQNLAPVTDNVPATTVTVNATDGDNAINYSQGPSGGIFVGFVGLVTVDNQESYEFNNKTNLVLNGQSGSDTINLHYNSTTNPAGLTGTITVNGGDPTGSDTLIVNGISGVLDNLRYLPTSVGAGTVVNDSEPQPNVLFTGVEHLTEVIQQTDGDGVRMDGTIGNDAIEFIPGVTNDSGTFVGTMDQNNATGFGPFTATPMSFTGAFPLANDSDVNFFNPGGTDSIVFNGTANDDNISIQGGEAGGTEFRNTLNGILMARLEVFNVASGLVRGLAGNDTINVTVPAGPAAVTLRIEGGDSDQFTDTLNYTASAGAATTVNLGTATITQATPAGNPVTYNGIERINLVSSGAGSTLAFVGTAGDDAFNFSPSALGAGSMNATATGAATLTSPLFTYTGVGGNITVNGGAGGNDTLNLSATNGSDRINVNQTAANALSYTQNAFTQLFTLTAVGTVGVYALGGDDLIQVSWLDALGITGGGVRYHVDGGTSFTRDRLSVVDNGTGDLMLYRKGGINTTGSVTIGPANANPLNVDFVNIDTMTPVVGAGGDIVTFKYDPYEFNDDIGNATDLGSAQTINVDPTIDPSGDPTFGLPGDQDTFRLQALKTGLFDIQALFRQIATVASGRPGLPGNGDLTVDVLNAAGTLLATTNANLVTGERLVVPVVSGQVYYVRVRGSNALAINNYSLQVENLDVPVPTVVDLLTSSDSGRTQLELYDNITNIRTATVDIQADLSALAARGLTILTAAQATAGITPGAAVQIFLNGVAIGFANVVPGTDNTHFQFTFPAAGLGALLEGVNEVTAAVRVFDISNPLVSGRGLVGSPPLFITLDTIAPAPPSLFLNPPDDSGIPNQPGTYKDNITKYAAANFTGNAESNSWVQLYVLDKNGIPQFDGTAIANAFGQYFIDPLLDLNDPAFFNLDGERNFLATTTDVATNQSTTTNLQIFLDTTGPRVAGITSRFVDACGNTVVVNLLDQTLDGTKVALPALNYIDVTLLDQPNRTDTFLYPAANETLATTPGNYGIVGKRTGAVTISSVIVLEDDTVSGSIGLTTYRLFLSKPLANDTYKFKIFDRIQDQAGNALDGDFNPPFLPSGDGVPGDDFVTFFSTSNTSAKLGTYANGSISLDLNSNFAVDSGSTVGTDAVIPYSPNGSAVFSGQFYAPGQTTVDGFDRLGTYGKEGTKYVFRLDFNNDADFTDPGEKIVQTALQINGMPIAGNWGPGATNLATCLNTGSNVGVFTGTTWYLDTNGNNIIESAAAGDRVLVGNMRGLPFTGDFDNDGLTDLGTYQNGVFYLDLTTRDGGGLVTGNTNYTFRATLPLATSGTASKLARPVAADFDGDGITDIGLFIPNQTTVPAGQANWFLMNSNSVPWDIAVPSGTTRGFKTGATGLGTDIAVTYGSAKALPVVGNFDPSTRKTATTPATSLKQAIANVAHNLTDLYFSSTDSTDFVMGKLRKGKGR